MSTVAPIGVIAILAIGLVGILTLFVVIRAFTGKEDPPPPS